MKTILEVASLHVDIAAAPATPVVRGVDLTVRAGQVHGLVGESGAGKTMVGRAILGMLPENMRISCGTIAFDGRDITHMKHRERRGILGREMALIPQNPMTALNPAARIERQFTDVLRLHLQIAETEARSRALDLLHDVHIREPERVLRQYPHELSGGMRQRILIAIAFAFRPKLIIADEPTTALDVTVQRQILRLVKELQVNAGTAVLFISHNLGVVAKICEALSVIHSGRIVESADATSLFRAPQHDYTRALIAATPRYDRPGDELKPIPPELTQRLLEEASALDKQRMI